MDCSNGVALSCDNTRISGNSALTMTSMENIRKRLETFVKVRSIDSVLTHLKQIFLFKHHEMICGSFNPDKIKIWMSSNTVIGAFYPVIQLKLNEKINKITISSKMNQVGFGLALLINLAIMWASLNLFILREGLTSESLLRRIIVFVVFIGIFNFPIYMSYAVARNVLIRKVKERIQVQQPLTERL